MSPSTAPSRVSPGPPWQIRRAMWLSRHPWGGSQSRHVAFTFCAGGLFGLSLAITRVRAETSAHFGTERQETVCTLNPQTKQLDVSKLYITCIFRRTSRLLASLHGAQNPECDSYLQVETGRRQNGLAFSAPELRLFWGYSCWFCLLAAPNIYQLVHLQSHHLIFNIPPVTFLDFKPACRLL